MTLKELAQQAINIDNASNLCGLAQSFAEAMIALGAHTNGTHERNTHPITKLWVTKLANLSGVETVGTESSAYCIVNDLAQGKVTK